MTLFFEVERYWEDIAYHSLRFPLMPYSNMAMPFIVASVGVEESRANQLKTAARSSYYSAKFWELIRNERMRPPTNPDGSITFSSNLFKRLYNTCRVPGVEKDEVQEYFKTKAEGFCTPVSLIIGRGRIFYFEFAVDGEIISPQEFLHIFTIARDIIENETAERGPPILTADERTSWANNRTHLKELSPNNAKLLEIVESAATVVCFDDNEPTDYSEVAQLTLNGDYHARWNDKSSYMISFRNGKFGLVGEHSAYDGTVSISFSTFVLMSMLEEPEPDWDELPKNRIIPKEIKFQLDDHLRSEISRMDQHASATKNSVIAVCQQFDSYGKTFMKSNKVHPDSYVQMGLQWAYYKLHKSFAPTYETATMRVFYHGRTETVRSCSIEVKEWIDKMTDPNATKAEKAKLFKYAANSQTRLMNEARKGNGIDRHLFGLWCIAQENGIPIPEFYDDPLYAKSGGGGNFVLSTSTLGYSINVGFVAPMVVDGYGVFYSMLNDCIWIIITTYRDSEVTSSKKFYDAFESSMLEIRELLEASNGAKL